MNWPGAADFTVIQGGHDGKSGVQSADGVAHRKTAAQRIQPFIAVDGHDSAQALNDLIVCGLKSVRAGLAETGNRAIDQARVDFGQFFIGKAQPVHDAGAEVFHQHIGRPDQFPEYFFRFCDFEIQRQ